MQIDVKSVMDAVLLFLLFCFLNKLCQKPALFPRAGGHDMVRTTSVVSPLMILN